MVAMTTLAVELDDDAVGWLRRRAQREGVEPAELAARLLTEVTAEPDPFDFVGSFASDTVAARDTDAYLSEHRARSCESGSHIHNRTCWRIGC
jgi:hypothetical protein